jgi:Ca2+-binding EF-hand superfamily protein
MIYDFCTLRMDGLVEWTFKLFDPDGSGKMSAAEFKEMARLCMGDEVSRQCTASATHTTTFQQRGFAAAAAYT